MATQTPTQNSEDIASQSPGQNRSGGNDPKIWTIPGRYAISGSPVIFEKIFIGANQITPTHGIPLKDGQILVFQGYGLNIFTGAAFYNESGAQLKKSIKDSDSNNEFFRLTIPEELSSLASDGSYLWLTLTNSYNSSYNRQIAPYLVYSINQEEKKKKAKQQKEEEEKRKLAAGAGVSQTAERTSAPAAAGVAGKRGLKTLLEELKKGPQSDQKIIEQCVAAIIKDDNGKGLDEALKSAKKFGANPGILKILDVAIKETQVATTVSGASPAGTAKGQITDEEDLVEETENEAEVTGQVGASFQSQQNFLTASQKVSSYISQSQTAITDTKAKGRILMALDGGIAESVQSLSAEDQQTLRGVLSAQVSGGSGQEADSLSASMKIVSEGAFGGGEVKVEAEAEAKTSGAQAPAGQAGQAEVSAEVEAEAKEKISAEAKAQQAGPPAGAGLKVEAEAEVKQPGSSSLAEAKPPVVPPAEAKPPAEPAPGASAPPPLPKIPSVPSPAAAPLQQAQPPAKPATSAPPSPPVQTGQAPAQKTQAKDRQGPSPSQQQLLPGKGKVDGVEAPSEQAKKEPAVKPAAAPVKPVESLEKPLEQKPISLDSAGAKASADIEATLNKFKKQESLLKSKVGLAVGSETSGELEETDEGKSTDQIRPTAPKRGSKSDTDVSAPIGSGNRLGGQENEQGGGGEPGDNQQAAPDKPETQGEPSKTGKPGAGDGQGAPGVGDADQDQEDLDQAIVDEEDMQAARALEAAAIDQARLRASGKLAGAAVGKATSQLWWWGFGFSAATFFTGLDFLVGAIIMNSYWVFMHRRQPKLFPLKGWQKIVSVTAAILPFIIIAFATTLFLTVGCNYPKMGGGGKEANYRLSTVGLIIGDSCAPFDLTNRFSDSPTPLTNTSASSPAATSPAPNPSPTTPTPPPTNPTTASNIFSFIKPWSGPEVYPAVDWGNADPNIDPAIKASLSELQSDFNSLNTAWQQAGHPALQPKQVYRSEAYQEHYRSIWEIFAVINGKNNTAGYLCDQTAHLDATAVSQAYAQASASDKQTLESLFKLHQISLTSTPAGCISDHASGIAMDIADQKIDGFNTALYSPLISAAQNYGLCHNIAGDQPHFALKDKLPTGTNCSRP